MSSQLALPGLDPPNVPLVISALVKSIRLRRTEDALQWLKQLWAFPSLRHRLTRRILISSAEDSMSPELIVQVARWFGGPHRYSFAGAASEVCRICATPSWWALPEGHEMMFAWQRAEFIAATLPISSAERCLDLLDRAIQLGDLLGGLGVFSRLSVMPEFGNLALVDRFSPHIERSGNARVAVLFDVWRGLSPVLGRDTNISGMLLYLMLGGNLPIVAVAATDSVQLTANLGVDSKSICGITNLMDSKPPCRISNPVQVPNWANDGIHARADGPIDRRFAGLLANFVAMCRAYRHYGRLDPDDPWVSEFFDVPK